MKRNFFFVLGLISLLSINGVFAQEAEDRFSDSAEAFAIIPNLDPEETKDYDIYRTKAIFKTNVKNCKVYLNNNFEGYSKLTLANLVEGFYLLRVEKEGYISLENFVYVERGKEKTFYVELEPGEELLKKQAEAQVQSGAEQTETVTATAEPEVQSMGSSTGSLGDAK